MTSQGLVPLSAHATPLPRTSAAEQMLRSDLLRSAWMFAVGAMDAYFCDAYTDIVAATIISKSRHQAAALPDFFYDIRFPVRAVLEPYANNENWRWRMAARKMMERENVLSLPTVQTLFNKFFRKGHKFFRDRLADWIVHPDAKKRRLGITRAAFAFPPVTRGPQSRTLRNRWKSVTATSSTPPRLHSQLRPPEVSPAGAATGRDSPERDSGRRVSCSPLRRTHKRRVS